MILEAQMQCYVPPELLADQEGREGSSKVILRNRSWPSPPEAEQHDNSRARAS